MACFTGGFTSHGLSLEPWHPIESFYDSREDASPIVQLCRMTEMFNTYFGRTPFLWTAIDTSIIDTAWADVGYSSISRDPMKDAATLFQELRNNLITLCGYSPFFGYEVNIGNVDCTAARLADGATIYGYASTILSGLDVNLREDWLAIIERIREVLEMMEASSVQLTAWYTSLVNYGLNTLFGLGPEPYSSYGAATGGVVEGYFLDPGSIYDLGSNTFEVRFGNTGESELNQYNTTPACSYDLSGAYGSQLYVGFSRGDEFSAAGSPAPYRTTYAKGGASFCECDTILSGGSYVNSGAPPPIGWHQQLSCTKKFQFLFLSAPVGFTDFTICDGVTTPWTAGFTHDGNLPEMSVAASPSSGTHVVVSGGIPQDLYVDFSVTNPNVGPYWPLKKACTPYISVPGRIEIPVCRDTCGNWVLG